MMVHSDFSLEAYNTFGVNQVASQFAILKKHTDILDAIQVEAHPLILGGGSNVLLTRDIETLVLKNELSGRTIIQEDNDFVWVKIESGENWHEVVKWTVGQGWGGLENMSLIPGTIGAAPIQNIGAYGVELKDVMTQLEVVDLHSGIEETYSSADCRFGYRDSVFKQPEAKGRYFIQNVTLKLNKQPKVNTRYADIEKKLEQKKMSTPSIRDIHEIVIEVRQQKLPDPATIGNAGSFFKNPVVIKSDYEKLKTIKPDAPGYVVDDLHVKVPAGWLIDQAGWKGKRIGSVGCYEKQALVIVNHGGATGGEIWSFAQTVLQDVWHKFGIRLEPEINIW